MGKQEFLDALNAIVKRANNDKEALEFIVVDVNELIINYSKDPTSIIEKEC